MSKYFQINQSFILLDQTKTIEKMANLADNPCKGLKDDSLASQIPPKCLQKIWFENGCTREGTIYPQDDYFGWWNNSPNGTNTVYCDNGNNVWPKCGAGNFGTTKNDIKAWATMTDPDHIRGCKGTNPCDGITDNTKASQVPISCIQKVWLDSGCKREGTMYPQNDYGGWLKQDNGVGTFSNIKKEIKNIVELSNTNLFTKESIGCKGTESCDKLSDNQKEVYHIGGYDKNWYQADQKCKEFGARLATSSELQEAFEKGADWCSSGHTKDNNAQFPLQVGRPGCGGRGVMTYGNPNDLRGANCYGVKPPEGTPGVMGFVANTIDSYQQRWSQFTHQMKFFIFLIIIKQK